MTQHQPDYDVIIIGGRVAGSALAARLGRYGFRVLMLERATLPSLPAVSSPIIYASTLRLLDEIGADEAAYAHNTPRIYHVATVANGQLMTFRLPETKGRDYAYAVDRARFDEALWENAIRHPNVTGYQNFSVQDILTEGERVVGITGKHSDGTPATFTAHVVIGADGRFSMLARRMQAQERDRHDAYPTSIYYAYWQDVAPVDADGTAYAIAYEGDGPYGYLMMDSADGQTVVVVEGRANELDPPAGQAEAFYLEMLGRNPQVQARLANATPVTTVRGMRHIGNCYRQPGGPGWALVGDAYHQKDPLDGQGMYNAVITGKALAQAMRRWRAGELTWEEALAEYDEVARVKTYPMFKALQTRVRASFYTDPSALPIPAWASARLITYITQDPQTIDLVGRMITRDVPPDLVTLLAPPTLLGAIARGVQQDVRQALRERLGLRI